MKMFWATVTLLLLFHLNGAWCCEERERESLLQFKASVLDPSNTLLNSWHGFNCCHWNGVQCHPRTLHVIRLDLHSDAYWNGMYLSNQTGDVLSPLFNLEHLEEINLRWNYFGGVSIPPGLGKLKSLRYLDLSWAGFSGDIPRELGNMSSLHYLAFGGLRMEEMQTWTGNMRDLRELILDDVDMSMVKSNDLDNTLSTMYSLVRLQMLRCDLSGGIPPSLAKLTNLTHLDLQGNDFNGSIPPALLSLPRLQHLDLSINYNLGGKLSSILPQHSASLHTLILSDTSVGGRIPDSVANISSLAILDLANCLVESIPITMANHTALEELELSYNMLIGHIPPFGDRSLTLGKPFPLARIYLSGNQLDGPIPPMLFTAFPSLQSVDFSSNQLMGSIPSPAGRLRHLTQLHLSSNSLTGKIPASLAILSSLVSLDFGNNKLSEKIPPSIGQLLDLEWLRLSNNKLEGKIPSSLANLSLLWSLDLSNNKLIHKIPPSITQLLYLEMLDLSNNKLEDVIPLTISKLYKLTNLYLQSNQLSGNFSDSHLHNLSRLVNVDVSNNLLTAKFSPTWIPKFSLHYLRLSSCNMEGGFPTFLITQYDIEIVDLSNNSLAGEIPQWIWNLHFLYNLNLSHNHFVGVLPHSVVGSNLYSLDLHNNNLQGQLPLLPDGMVMLDISENQLSGSIPTEFGEYRSLRILFLYRNHFSGSIPSSLLCRIQLVDLSNNNLTGKIPACYLDLSSIEILNLENNTLNGGLAEQFANMSSLQTLKLGGNRLNSYIPSSLAKCKQLEIIDLNNNKMGGFIPKWIGQLSNLKVLILRSNIFEGTIPSEVTALPLLQILDLSSNRFSGVIPINISSLRALKNKTISSNVFGLGNVTNPIYVDQATIINKAQKMEYARSLALVKCIDLSNNNIAGEIPPNIGLLEGLVILNVSRNNISGEISKSLGGIVMLESLDLSHNHLFGNIPLELQSLTFLGYLDLSHNNLSGSIPEGGHLLTFDESSFSNNADLCGLQLNTSCCDHHPCPSIPPGTKDDKIDEKEDDIWWGVGVGMSYAVGFSIVIGILCLTTTWSIKCFHVMDTIIIYLFERFRK